MTELFMDEVVESCRINKPSPGYLECSCSRGLKSWEDLVHWVFAEGETIP